MTEVKGSARAAENYAEGDQLRDAVDTVLRSDPRLVVGSVCRLAYETKANSDMPDFSLMDDALVQFEDIRNVLDFMLKVLRQVPAADLA